MHYLHKRIPPKFQIVTSALSSLAKYKDSYLDFSNISSIALIMAWRCFRAAVFCCCCCTEGKNENKPTGRNQG